MATKTRRHEEKLATEYTECTESGESFEFLVLSFDFWV